MKRLSILASLFLGLLIAGASCSSDPNVEGAKLDLNNKDYDRALQNVETALERNPANAEALELKGRILQEMAFAVTDTDEHTRLVRDMVTAFNRAMEHAPAKQEDITQRLRLAYYNEFQRGIQAFNRGNEDEQHFDTAVKYFENAAVIQPDSAGAYTNQAFSLIRAGRSAEAIEPFEKAIDRGDDQPDTYVFLADLYLANQRASDAVELLEKANERFPGNADLQAQLFNVYNVAGQSDRAVEVAKAAVEREPNNKLFLYNYGSLLLNAERFDEAIEQLSRAVAVDPDYANAQYNLGAAYINKAVDLSERMNELDDELRERRSALSAAQIADLEGQIEALVQERAQLFGQAITPLERAQELMVASGEDVGPVCQALFTSYVQTGQQQKAEAVSECAGY
jgi:tetratricopeptide (TPR) repeat protein